MQRPDLALFPDSPGVYLYKDASGKILYVGKARRLRRRIASYFRPEEQLPSKTTAMLRRAESLDFLSTGTEKEALLLEAGLIKKHKPRYNILLRDDKEYLLFRIAARHPYPRVEIVRRARGAAKKTGDKIFGPFSSGGAARETWKIIHKQFPLRRCRDAAFANRTRPCLYYDIGQCPAPCVLPVPQEEYAATLRKVEMLLSGRSRELTEKLRAEMLAASDALDFEQAARLRDQLRAVERTLERQSVVLGKDADLDLIGVAENPEGQTPGLALGLAFVRDGMLLDQRAFFFPGLVAEDLPDLLSGFLSQFYLQGRAVPPGRIVVPWLPEPAAGDETDEADSPSSFAALEQALADLRGGPVQIRAPRNADEDNLVLMAAGHALDAARKNAGPSAGELLAQRLHRAEPVRRIEAVDISHTGGRQTRAGMVVFEDEEPRPEDFRAYAIETDSPGDDYAALAAWAERRIASGPPWPDLFLIDGGKGQLAAVERVFRQAFPEWFRPELALQTPPAQTPAAGSSEDPPTAVHPVSGDASLAPTDPVPVNSSHAAAEPVSPSASCPTTDPVSLSTPHATTLEPAPSVFPHAATDSASLEPAPFSPPLLAGLAKARDEEGRADRRAGNVEDRLFLPGRSNPVPLRPGSPELLFLQRIRDAVHDFSLGRHRRARTKAALAGELTRLPGIGPELARRLFERFGSLKAMAEADADALRTVPGVGKARAGQLAARLRALAGVGER